MKIGVSGLGTMGGPIARRIARAGHEILVWNRTPGRDDSLPRESAVSVRSDAGMSTAEYAVGTVAAAGLGGILIKLLTSPEVRDLIWSVLSNAFQSLFG